MDTMSNVVNMVRSNDYMVKLDQKDAFFSVQIAKNH